MRRRDFISLVGGAIAALSSVARAQQVAKVPRVGYLWHAGSAEEEGPYFRATLEGPLRRTLGQGTDTPRVQCVLAPH